MGYNNGTVQWDGDEKHLTGTMVKRAKQRIAGNFRAEQGSAG